MATEEQRRRLRSLMAYLLDHEADIRYAQVRPMREVRLTWPEAQHRLQHGPGLTFDCSESVTCLCRWAGLHDPNGNGYNGHGYTGTLLGHLPHYTSPASARVGALAVFGPGTGEHVAMVYAPGSNPLMWSHGSTAGPQLIRLASEARLHAPPVTFLSIAAL
jgi:hypothetical protein